MHLGGPGGGVKERSGHPIMAVGQGGPGGGLEECLGCPCPGGGMEECLGGGGSASSPYSASAPNTSTYRVSHPGIDKGAKPAIRFPGPMMEPPSSTPAAAAEVDALSSALGSKPPRRLPMAPGGRPPELPAAAMEPPSSTPAVAAEVDALSSALGSKPPVGAAQSCKTQHCSSVLQRHWTSGGGTGGGGGSTGGKKGIDAGLMAMGQRGPESASQSMPNGAGRATWKVSSKEPQFTTVRWCLGARPGRQPNLWPDLGGDNVWTQGV